MGYSCVCDVLEHMADDHAERLKARQNAQSDRVSMMKDIASDRGAEYTVDRGRSFSS